MRESITVNGRVRVDVKREGKRKRKKSRTGKKRVDNKLTGQRILVTASIE